MSNLYSILKYIYRKIVEFYEIYVKRQVCKKKVFDNNKNNIFIISTPEYGNIGDHAIAYSMKKYVQAEFKNYQIYEIADSELLSSMNWIIKNNKSTDYIFLIGGGNFGDLYIIVEYWRRMIISKCRNAKIILFPQSSVWGESLYSKLQLRCSRKIYSKNHNLFLMARERKTYELMDKFFSNPAYLVPDIVFTYEYSSKFEKNVDVLLCMRSDIEKDVDQKIIDYIENYLVERNITFERFDTETYSSIAANESKKIVDETIEKFAKAKWVITDRLHGVIFSQITGTPCLAIDNLTKKISGVFELWVEKRCAILFDKNVNLDKQIEQLLSFNKFEYDYKKNKEIFDIAMKSIICVINEN